MSGLAIRRSSFMRGLNSMDKICKAVETGKCIGCGNCKSVCPVLAIEFHVNNGFQYPEVDDDKCIKCSKCDRVCPINGGHLLLSGPLSYYAAYAKEEAMPTDSTSGGICTLASELMIKNGGVVYSARFTDDWNVEYSKVDRLEKLKDHVGSKYMQAYYNDVQKQIAEDLKANLKVLLIGTPCFIGAVKKYLTVGKIDSENFITIDFLCHGVPSAEVAVAFIKSLEKQSGRKLEKYNFRSKDFGWGKLSRSVKFVGKPKKCTRADFCPLHTWFGQHLSLRESCFQCDYRSVDRPSDITVADFWKIDKYYPEIPMKQGVSAVQINTECGNAFYNALNDTGKLYSHTVTKESIWEHRRTATKNFEKPSRYNEFWTVWESQRLDGIMKMVPAQTVLGLVIGKLKRMAR